MALSLSPSRTAPAVLPVQMGWFIALINGDFLRADVDRVLTECQALGPWEGAWETDDRTV